MRDDTFPIPAYLVNSPEVFELSKTLQVSEPTAIGLLYRFWAWTESNGKDRGRFIKHATISTIDKIIDVKGLGKAMMQIRAVEEIEDGLQILWQNRTPSRPQGRKPRVFKLIS